MLFVTYAIGLIFTLGTHAHKIYPKKIRKLTNTVPSPASIFNKQLKGKYNQNANIQFQSIGEPAINLSGKETLEYSYTDHQNDSSLANQVSSPYSVFNKRSQKGKGPKLTTLNLPSQSIGEPAVILSGKDSVKSINTDHQSDLSFDNQVSSPSPLFNKHSEKWKSPKFTNNRILCQSIREPGINIGGKESLEFSNTDNQDGLLRSNSEISHIRKRKLLRKTNSNNQLEKHIEDETDGSGDSEGVHASPGYCKIINFKKGGEFSKALQYYLDAQYFTQ